MNVSELCYADMLAYGLDTAEPGWYIVRRIWLKPVWTEREAGQEKVGPPLTYRLEGFDLIESRTGTLRQVTAAELQQQLNEGTLTFHHPPTVRRVTEFR